LAVSITQYCHEIESPTRAYPLLQRLREGRVDLPAARGLVRDLREHVRQIVQRVDHLADVRLLVAYFLVTYGHAESVRDFLRAGTYWLLMILAFEWMGSFILRRPVYEILEGWHLKKGYMWPYVLLAYFLSPLIVGLTLSRATRWSAGEVNGL
jgi:hypothetical protein